MLLLAVPPVSHMVIEEVSTIQENLEIEKSCRQSAEVLASKVSSTLGRSAVAQRKELRICSCGKFSL